jgi:hypothetical protein
MAVVGCQTGMVNTSIRTSPAISKYKAGHFQYHHECDETVCPSHITGAPVPPRRQSATAQARPYTNGLTHTHHSKPPATRLAHGDGDGLGQVARCAGPRDGSAANDVHSEYQALLQHFPYLANPQ